MMTLESTQDLLYLVLAISVIWVAAMLTWLLFEAALVLRNANRIIHNVRMKLLAIEEAVESVRGKVAASAGYLGFLTKGVKSIMHVMQVEEVDEDEEEEKPKRRRRKK